MNRYLCGLIGLTLLGAGRVLAQAPAAVPPAAIGAPLPVTAQPAPVANPVVVTGQPAGGCCNSAPAGCCTTNNCDTVTCVPEHYMKKTTTTCYSHGTEHLCLCYFPSCCLRRSCDCESGHCEHPICRRYLIKKVHTCEQDAIKCVPSQAPACATGHCGAAAGCASAAPAATTPYVIMPQGTVVTTEPQRNVVTPMQQTELVISAAQPR
jgi:hypothetical protein